VSNVTAHARAIPRASASSAHLEPDHRLWLDVLARLRANHPDICRHWFEEIEAVGLDGGVLRLRAHSAIHRDYLQRNCSNQFTDAARLASGNLIAVRFLGPDEEVAPSGAARPSADRPAGPRQVVPAPAAPVELESLKSPGLDLNPDYTFEHFVIGPNNRMAHHAAKRVADAPGHAYNPLFIHGQVGLGKTHLLQAICIHLKRSRPDIALYYTSCDDFMTQYFDAFQAGQSARFRAKFRHVDVLVIDDIHFLTKRDRSQEEFFHTFNALHQARKQIILSSDAKPEEIPRLEERLVSRFMSGLVCDVQAPCYETRIEILRGKAALRGLDLPMDVAKYLAERIDSNIRELEGAISRLQMIATVEGRAIDLDLARSAYNERTPHAEPKIQIQTIIDSVTGYYGVKIADLVSKRRQRSIALPRQVCMYLARKNTRYSLEEIGTYFGGRDHTTVMHAVRTIEDRRGQDAEFAKIVTALEERLRLPA
jgi:chromosomal replication initiator protein